MDCKQVKHQYVLLNDATNNITPIPSSLHLNLTSTCPSLDAKAVSCSSNEEVANANNIVALILIAEYFIVAVVIFFVYFCSVVQIFGFQSTKFVKL